MDELVTNAAQAVESSAKDVSTWFHNIMDTVIEFCTKMGFKLVFAILVLVVGFRLITKLTRMLKKGKLSAKVDPTVGSFLRSLINIGLKIILLVSVAALLGFPTTTLITVIGSAGLAVGLALQGSLGNIAGGFIILVFKPFVVGDYISAGEHSGTVTGINLFYTKIVTVDNRKIMIPNSIVSNQTLVDISALPTRRDDFKFSVAYDSDIDAVKKILLDTAAANDKILDDPEPIAYLSSNDDSCMTFTLRVWCKNEDIWPLTYEINEKIKRAFDDNGISIPYPQLDVHLDK